MAKEKMDAVFELREAAQELGRQEEKLEREPSPQARDAVLDARLELEGKTANALDACEECGREHCDDANHRKRRTAVVAHAGDNVIRVEFNDEQPADVRADSEAERD